MKVMNHKDENIFGKRNVEELEKDINVTETDSTELQFKQSRYQ